jgi:predicted Mrr-cat superfamily restriction endonuclease
MTNYYRVSLGRKNVYALAVKDGNFIGVDFLPDIDLSGKLDENWRDFNKEMIPVWQEQNPGKTKVVAGLSCGSLWTVCKGILEGDLVLCPDGSGNYLVGEITGQYYYSPGVDLPHRRAVRWVTTVPRSALSKALQHSAGSMGTAADISKYADELDQIIGADNSPSIIATDEAIEDPTVFALEKHLEEFLVHNWQHTELGKQYSIYEVDGDIVGEQYPTDTGPIDILAISKDKKELLVVELKRGRISDVVVGQILRYMGYVKDELAENNQKVRGVIIALEDDIKLRRALSVTNNINFMTYKVRFTLSKVAV